jgi:hypothetical protein
VKQEPNGFSLPLQDQLYALSMTRKALRRSATRIPKAVPPPPVPVVKEKVPVAKEKEKQKKQSLRRSSRNNYLLSKPTPRRSPSEKKDPPPRRETRSTSTTIHQKKKSKNASKVRNFLIPPPKASQSLTSAQRTSLENFGLQKGMIRRATYLYFWWRSNLVPASFPKNLVSSYFNLSFVIDSHEKIDIIRN